RRGVCEGLQVALQGTGVGGLVEPPAQFRGVVRGQFRVTVLPGQFDDGGGTQPPVEMVVQKYLRCPTDLFDCEWLIHVFRMPARGERSGSTWVKLPKIRWIVLCGPPRLRSAPRCPPA